MRVAKGARVLRVLVVDDEQLIRWSLRQRLERAGYAVTDAPDGRSALRRAPGADVAVVDRKLPDADGLAVAAALHRRRPRRPVILMTAYGSPELDKAAIDLGIDAVVQKPFELDDMLELIASELRRS